MIGRQLPFMALILPFYVMFAYGGARSVEALWPVLLVAGGSFAIFQFVTANYIDYSLTDVLASLGSLVVTLALPQVWQPAPDPEFAIHRAEAGGGARRTRRRGVAGLAAMADRRGRRHRLDLVQGVRDRPARRSPGRASTRRSRSLSTTTSPTPRCGCSSRSPRAPRILVAALITALVFGLGADGFIDCVGAHGRGRFGSRSSPSASSSASPT